MSAPSPTSLQATEASGSVCDVDERASAAEIDASCRWPLLLLFTSGVLWLDLAGTGLREREAALSRLCAWVLRADGSGQDYGLRLPAQTIAPGHGPSHRQQCLEALALC